MECGRNCSRQIWIEPRVGQRQPEGKISSVPELLFYVIDLLLADFGVVAAVVSVGRKVGRRGVLHV